MNDGMDVDGMPALPTTAASEHPVRALLPVTVVMLVVGHRRGDRRWTAAAPVPAAVGLLGFGVTGMAGQWAFALALTALVVAVRRDGVLPTRHRLPRPIRTG